VQQAGILGVMAAEAEDQERGDREQYDSQQLVPLLRGERGPLRTRALLADDGYGHS